MLYTGISRGLKTKAGFSFKFLIVTQCDFWAILKFLFFEHLRKKSQVETCFEFFFSVFSPYFWANVPSCFAIMMMPFMAESTGIASKFAFLLSIKHRKAPFPPATRMPGGPKCCRKRFKISCGFSKHEKSFNHRWASQPSPEAVHDKLDRQCLDGQCTPGGFPCCIHREREFPPIV